MSREEAIATVMVRCGCSRAAAHHALELLHRDPTVDALALAFDAGVASQATRLHDLQQREQGLSAELTRLQGWLDLIEGGDTPCTDQALLRRWAYEARILGKEAPDGW